MKRRNPLAPKVRAQAIENVVFVDFKPRRSPVDEPVQSRLARLRAESAEIMADYYRQIARARVLVSRARQLIGSGGGDDLPDSQVLPILDQAPDSADSSPESRTARETFLA